MRPPLTALVKPSPNPPETGREPIPGLGAVAPENHDIAELAHRAAQIEKSLEFLIRSHELEITQRQALEEKLDRLVEELESGSLARPTNTLADDIRNGVSNDLKPLLHVVIDFLDLATRPPTEAEGPQTDATRDDATREEAAPADCVSAEREPDDELPRALPEILTKSVAELVGTQGNRRANGAESNAAPRTQWGKSKQERKLSAGTRAQVWIPVAPGKPGS